MARRKSATRFAILGMLNDSPMSGYDLKKRIESELGHFWRESYGKIYPELRTMVERGLATVRKESQDGRPSRKVYTITVNGMVELKKWVSSPPDDPLGIPELLLKIYHGHQVSPANTVALLERLLEAVDEQLLHTRQAIEAEDVSGSGPDSDQRLHRHITLSYRLRYCEFLRSWCVESLEMLRKGSRTDTS